MIFRFLFYKESYHGSYSSSSWRFKKRPFYQVVVADKRASRDGRFIEKIGFLTQWHEVKKLKPALI